MSCDATPMSKKQNITCIAPVIFFRKKSANPNGRKMTNEEIFNICLANSTIIPGRYEGMRPVINGLSGSQVGGQGVLKS